MDFDNEQFRILPFLSQLPQLILNSVRSFCVCGSAYSSKPLLAPHKLLVPRNKKPAQKLEMARTSDVCVDVRSKSSTIVESVVTYVCISGNSGVNYENSQRFPSVRSIA